MRYFAAEDFYWITNNRNESGTVADFLSGLGHFGLFAIAVGCVGTEFFLDAEELVVLGHTVGTACRTGLDLSGVGSYGDVGDGSVLGFARAVRDNCGVAVALSEFYGAESLGE